MKVFDLACEFDHRFEGWFASSEDFEHQVSSKMLTCPVCGSLQVHKKLSAPRINLGAAQVAASQELSAKPTTSQMQKLWLEMARSIAANTEDVGERFVEEARKIHYQEAPERGIRGVASREEVAELADEGIDIVSFSLPEVAKTSLQ